VIDCFVIADLHESIFPATSGTDNVGALGDLAAASAPSISDATENDSRMPKLAVPLGGKAFITLTGDVAAKESAVAASAPVVAPRW